MLQLYVHQLLRGFVPTSPMRLQVHFGSAIPEPSSYIAGHHMGDLSETASVCVLQDPGAPPDGTSPLLPSIHSQPLLRSGVYV